MGGGESDFSADHKCGFSNYLQIYQGHRKALLARRGLQTTNYPDSVATTWSLSFQKVEQANPAAAELLRLCAFLAPDTIPEELIRGGVAHWSSPLQQVIADPFQLDQAIAELLKFSLIKRFTQTQSLSIHRLVQAVLIDTIEQDAQSQWAERIVRAVNDVFPDPGDVALWSQCSRYLDQIQVCAILIRQYTLTLVEAAEVLNRASVYLEGLALYSIMEPLLQQALATREKQLGPEHPDTADTLFNLARLYQRQGKYEAAKLLFQRALATREKQLGPEHSDTAASLSGLGFIYRDLGNYIEAELLYQRALSIYEQQLGPEHFFTRDTLILLAALYKDQGKYTTAESLFQRALSIQEKQLEQHQTTATTLTHLAVVYRNQGKYAEAEPLFQRALAIREQLLGSEHPYVAHTLSRLANLYQRQGRYTEAEPLFQRALAIYEQWLGVEHPDTAEVLYDFAVLREVQGNRDEAMSLYQRALAIREQALGLQHPETVATRTYYRALLQETRLQDNTERLERSPSEQAGTEEA